MKSLEFFEGLVLNIDASISYYLTLLLHHTSIDTDYFEDCFEHIDFGTRGQEVLTC